MVILWLRIPDKKGEEARLTFTYPTNIIYKIRHDLMKRYDHSHYESIFIDIKLNNKTFIIGFVYKPPNTRIGSFNDELLSILNSISREKKHSILMGDFNLN